MPFPLLKPSHMYEGLQCPLQALHGGTHRYAWCTLRVEDKALLKKNEKPFPLCDTKRFKRCKDTYSFEKKFCRQENDVLLRFEYKIRIAA